LRSGAASGAKKEVGSSFAAGALRCHCFDSESTCQSSIVECLLAQFRGAGCLPLSMRRIAVAQCQARGELRKIGLKGRRLPRIECIYGCGESRVIAPLVGDQATQKGRACSGVDIAGPLDRLCRPVGLSNRTHPVERSRFS
jgi:hypothetical protein